MPLHPGLYDLLLTREVERVLESAAVVGELRDLDADEAADRLAEVLGSALRRILADAAETGEHGVDAQLALVNDVLRELRARHAPEPVLVDEVAAPPRVLRSVRPGGAAAPAHPETGLAVPWLFTAGRGSPHW
jgi:hypothetical protein